MSLRPSELAQVVAELDEKLRGATVQRVHVPEAGLAYLELRLPGRSVLLCVSVQPGTARLGVAKERPPAPLKALPLQQRLRKELEGFRVAAVRQSEQGVVLEFEKAGEKKVLAPGTLPFSPSGVEGRLPTAPRLDPGSRLIPLPGSDFPYAEAAEQLVSGKAAAVRVSETRRALIAPVRAKRVKLARTLDKVRAEASRQAEADLHRQHGELLSRNLDRIARGAREVRLTEYAATGPIERVVPLDPALPPKAQAERHFHQYRRLLRGCEQAARRVVELEAERSRLAAELARLEALADDELGRMAGPASPGPGRKKPKQPRASGFREYLSASGAPIWVGKNAAGNDALTFEQARPHHLWLHARGVSGSHVVVPLEKGRAVSQEVLLDAAHLALFHSDAKGEPRGEVSYTPVKFVRRQKGGAPGQVTFTRDRTLLVRVEPERLRRLTR